MATNRTINFYGYAYGSLPVQLNAHINGVAVFSGAVSTLNEPMPSLSQDMTNAPILFSVDSTLFPTEFAGSYPMTISVATGTGIKLAHTYSNYMGRAPVVNAVFTGSISGTTITVSAVTSGTIAVGQSISGPNIIQQFGNKIISGSGATWEIGAPQTVSETTVTTTTSVPGTSDVFLICFNGTPANSEGTPDSRSSVYIDAIQQVPPQEVSFGEWYWEVFTGSTLSCNFNVSAGSVAA